MELVNWMDGQLVGWLVDLCTEQFHHVQNSCIMGRTLLPYIQNALT
jgi:hypothetical protein